MGWSDLLNNNDIFSKKSYIFNTNIKQKIKLESNYNGRLDLVALDNYTDKQYWWILAEINNIIFPFDEIVYGTELTITPISAIISFKKVIKNAEVETISL